MNVWNIKKIIFFLLRIEKHDIFVPKNGKHTHTYRRAQTDTKTANFDTRRNLENELLSFTFSSLD